MEPEVSSFAIMLLCMKGCSDWWRCGSRTWWCRFIVIPQRPEGTEGWTEKQLLPLATRDSLIGVSLARQPGTA